MTRIQNVLPFHKEDLWDRCPPGLSNQLVEHGDRVRLSKLATFMMDHLYGNERFTVITERVHNVIAKHARDYV